MRNPVQGCTDVRAFTLVELLVAIAIIALLAALLLPALVQGKARAQSTACKSHLRQIGIALKAYISDSGRYPPEGGLAAGHFVAWADRLYPNAPRSWTNSSWQCPTYVAKQGLVRVVEPVVNDVYTSYAYNEWGMVDVSRSPRLGLIVRPRLTISDSDVAAPSEMITIGDSRTFRNSRTLQGFIEPLHGLMQMQPWNRNTPHHPSEETDPVHGQGYNLLFADGHVSLLKRGAYLYPPRAAHHWNRDNQPHPELWRPTNAWAVEN